MDIIIDLDGTLADLTHRRHLVATKPKNWKAFFALASKDTCIEPIAMIARGFAMGNRVIICSGRPDDLREVTEAWLSKHVWEEARWLNHSGLYMRKTGDYRPDDIVKRELYDEILRDGFRPVLAIDDRMRVIEMWKSLGLLVLAVNGGDDF